MNLDYINEFVTLANEQNYSRAADLLSISQAALSQHIQKLEEEVGEQLFVTVRRKTELTSFGKFFYNYAASLTKTYTTYRDDYRELFTFDINIGSMDLLRAYHLDNLIASYQKSNKLLNISMDESANPKLITLVENHQLDLAFVCLPDPEDKSFVLPPALESIPLYSDDFCVMMAPENTLAPLESLQVSDLKEQRFLWCASEFLSVLHNSFTPVIIYSGDLDNIAPLLKGSRNKIAILQYQEAMLQANETHMLVKPLRPSASCRLCLISRKKDKTKEARRFIQYAKTHFSELCESFYY